jgi:hypothetical protein
MMQAHLPQRFTPRVHCGYDFRPANALGKAACDLPRRSHSGDSCKPVGADASTKNPRAAMNSLSNWT